MTYETWFSGVYISETSHKSHRSSLGVMQALGVSVAFLSMYTADYLLSSWRSIVLVGLVLPVLGTATMFWLPETPYWLLEQGREEEARFEITDNNVNLSESMTFTEKIVK